VFLHDGVLAAGVPGLEGSDGNLYRACMRHLEDTFTGRDGISIFWQAWLPDGEIRGVVVVAHGFGEHSGRYENLTNVLVPKGFAVYIPDHRGHGKSGGVRAFIDVYDHLLDDLDVVMNKAAADHAGLPFFLLGHSMGGNIALSSALRKQSHLTGLILSGPSASVDGVPKLLQLVVKVIAKVAPTSGIRQLSADGVSRDAAVVKAYIDDPMVFHGKMAAGTAAAMMKASQGFPARLPSLRVPLLVVHGSADQLVPVASGRLVDRLAGSPDKTLKVYDGLAHEVFNEPEKATVLNDVAQWLESHLAVPAIGG
jgi:acylglycerol lipase